MNKFYTEQGWLTSYAFACGYLHESTGDNGYHVSLAENNTSCNTFEIKVYHPNIGRVSWDVVEGIVKARIAYKKAVKKYLNDKPSTRFEHNPSVNREVFA